MSNLRNLIRPDLQDFNAYSSARDEASSGAIWLNANESPFAQLDNDLMLNRYPSKQHIKLRERLAEIYGTSVEQLGLFRGSDEAIDLLMRLFCRARQDAILQCVPTFGMYAVYAKLQGAEVINVSLDPMQDFKINLDLLHAAWKPAVKIIFLCSPNNPSGNIIDPAVIASLCAQYKDKSVIVVDEAYIEFSTQPSMAQYINQFSNLAVLRTLSKAYGLAGIRLGVLLACKELINWITAIMAPYPLPATTVAIALQALSLEKLPNYARQVEIIQAERQRVFLFLQQCVWIGKVWQSEGNFLLIKVKDSHHLMRHCAKHGVILRHMHGKAGLEQCIRISIGTPTENNILLSILEKLS